MSDKMIDFWQEVISYRDNPSFYYTTRNAKRLKNAYKDFPILSKEDQVTITLMGW